MSIGMKDTPALEPTIAEDAKLRLERIRQYLLDSLEQPDSLRANLGVTSSDLMRMAYRLNEAIEDALDDTTDPSGRLQKLMPAIECYLRVVRQIDRFAQLDRLFGQARQAGESKKAR